MILIGLKSNPKLLIKTVASSLSMRAEIHPQNTCHPKETFCFPRHGLGGKHLVTKGVAWRPEVTQVLHSKWQVNIGSLTRCVRESGGESKNWILEQSVNTKVCSSI